jgi:cell division protein FtsI/penicillin-binding protein 2
MSPQPGSVAQRSKCSDGRGARAGSGAPRDFRYFTNRISGLALFCWAGVSAGCGTAPKPGVAPESRPLAGPEQAAVDAVLGSGGPPAAAVVLGLDGTTRVLALGKRGGVDPVTYLARPGSTVKPLVAWLAAEAGVYHAGDGVTCRGDYPSDPRFHCFEPHGALDLTRAIEVSCNVYFMALGERLGLARLATGLAELGLTRPTGLVPGELSGWSADPAWAARRAGDTTHWELPVGMGHGPLEVTPLELAVAYGKLAARLNAPSPRVPNAVRAEIDAGLRQVVAATDGTGHGAFVEGLELAGKTGSAEPSRFDAPPPDEARDNGWFVGYAPASAPTRLVAVLVLASGPGGQTAAPLAGRIFESMRNASGNSGAH